MFLYLAAVPRLGFLWRDECRYAVGVWDPEGFFLKECDGLPTGKGPYTSGRSMGRKVVVAVLFIGVARGGMIIMVIMLGVDTP